MPKVTSSVPSILYFPIQNFPNLEHAKIHSRNVADFCQKPSTSATMQVRALHLDARQRLPPLALCLVAPLSLVVRRIRKFPPEAFFADVLFTVSKNATLPH
jgi:hypothetical protein